MQVGTVSRLWFCGRSGGLKKSTAGGTLCVLEVIHFVPISWMCEKQNSVSHSSQNQKSFPRERRDPYMILVRVKPHKLPTRKKFHGKIDDLNNVDFTSSNVHTFRKEALLCIFEDNEAVIKMIINEEAPQWDMVPEPTELLLIGCSIEPVWTPRSKSNTLTPKTNSQTYWPKEISHVMTGIIFCVCSTSAITVPSIDLKRCRKETQEDAGEERVTEKIKADDEFGLTIQREGSERSCFDCIGKPGENQIWKSERTSEFVKWAANKNRQTWDGRYHIKPLWMEHWRQAAFSRVKILWMLGAKKNGENRRWQVCHRWWYGLCRYHSWTGWMIDWERCWTNSQRCNTRQQQTFFNMVNGYVVDTGSICIHGKELLRK